ncbi:Beta-N-acetylhexosaminidase [Alteripontixanthobacter maritimus]|uniref:beta-N-acetylhexosaminidase n=1 Tax=Alteripontixanthobacter maritimus TaxID=2161824 RepID=A0A369QAK5_9SPHN|nr:beta-N-acetylhexosaminidase [Alteripontixanthobacter maritimus]RDC59308.1 Beta-N-acetylhexosaminidase [Alteripontixanthobacter maritimus]
MVPAIFGIAGAQLSADERAFFKAADPAGYILFGRNCETRDQMRALTDSIRELHGRDDVLISIDQEGGRVARMKPPEWPGFPAGEIFDKLYQIAPATAIEAARINAEALGRSLAEVGVNVDYYPSLDVRQAGAHDVIGDRALGSEPMQVAALGRAILDGLERAGVVGCIKHMPGHGRTTTDTHKEMPTVTATEAELEIDLEPFRTLSHAPIGMTGHLLFTAWDADNAATQSRFVVQDIIRGKIGFDGLLLTDDIDMEALSGTVPERSERALAAGCDLTLNCWAKLDDMTGIAQRNPQISEESRARLDRAMAHAGKPAESGPMAELFERRDSLLAQVDNDGVPDA